MLEYIEDARRALNAKAYYSALCFSLTLPDVCAQVEYPNEKTVGVRYSRWINQFVDTSAFIHDQSMLNGNDFGEFIYKIRCSIVHSGNLDLNLKSGHEVNFQLINSDFGDGKALAINIDADNPIIELPICDLIAELLDSVEDYYSSQNNKTQFEKHFVKLINPLFIVKD